LVTIAVILTVTTYMAAQVARTAPDMAPTGKGWGESVDHSNGSKGEQKPTGQSRTNGISYHGGPVMGGTPNVYYIWYGNWSGNTATTLLPTLVSDLSGSSYEHINTTYTISGTQVTGTMALAGQTNDNYSQGSALSDAQVQAVVAAHCADFGGCNSSSLYFVLTSADVNETSGFCTQYCGWHTHGTINGADIRYAFVGNPDRCPSSCAQDTTLSPNNNVGADGMASIIAHESEEAISDPDLNAWYDVRGNENADKCAWTFGTTTTATNGAVMNFTGKSGTQWLIQRNWVNASGGYCSMSY
jgi:hypothetical protein